MGLTVHHTLRLRRSLRGDEAEALVRAMHEKTIRFAKRRGLADWGEVMPASDEMRCLRWIQVREDSFTTRGIEVPPLEGWCFAINPGEDCEPAVFGLCRYPATVHDGETGRTRRTRAGTGWWFSTFCKTQYASLHGWPHFLRCHRAVVDLALLWAEAGVEVSITDEGGYWPDRDVRRLHRVLDENNAAAAGLAGALKDAADERGEPPVQALIFRHPDFERLEAEGEQRLGDQIREFLR